MSGAATARRTARPADARVGKAEASRREILDTAARLFAARGYADTSLRDVAAAVGMKAGSLYYHFPSKEALAAEVLGIGVERIAEAVDRAITDAPSDSGPRARVEIAIRAHLATLLHESDYTSAHIRCLHYAPEAVKRDLRDVRRRYEAVWSGLIAELLPEAEDAERRHLRLALLGALNWSLEWFDPARDDADAFAAALARLLPAVDG